MRTKAQIVKEIIALYSNPKNRAVVDGGCRYFINGKKCAIGHMLLDPEKYDGILLTFPLYQKIKVDNSFKVQCYDILSPHATSIRQDMLKEEYRGHTFTEKEMEANNCQPWAFYRDLKHFHDHNEHFTEAGLSPQGYKYARYLTNTYK